MGGISVWQLLIILVIVLLLFGTKKLRNLGSDLGSSIKSFRKAVKDGEDSSKDDEPEQLEKSEEPAKNEAESKQKDQV